jgi:glyoxylase-like metal-dependent hydrolase (beta-lactamase superfamily II)
VFGPGTRPAAILLTHIHPDHDGSAAQLARAWEVPVYVHPDELPMAGPDYPPSYVNPADRRISAVVTRLIPARMRERIRIATDLRGLVRGIDPQAELPELPDWETIPTPGHTPGHVAFFRRSDRVLITGDAVLTIDANSLSGIMCGRQQLGGPPRFFTWNWPNASESIAVLAALEPHVLATGHGRPMVGPATTAALRAFAEKLRTS